MGKTSQKEKRLAGRVSLALAAGMFSVVPVAYGMPTADVAANTADRRSDGLGLSTSGNVLNVTGQNQNTVAHWKDFSIKKAETVHFEENKNFMNIVTGKATSAIDGALTGGNNVYLINPNGVIFGATAQVNVGNLYVSTRDDFENLKQNFTGKTATGTDATVAQQTGSAVLTALNSDSVLKADVVSLIDDKGYVAATQVVMEGKNIRFLNANQLAAQDVSAGEPVITDNLPTSVTGNATDGFSVAVHPDAANVIFRANTLGTTKNTDNYGDGYIHVGNGKNLGTGKSYADTINYTAQNLNQTARTVAGTNGETVGVVNYSLIHTADDLQNINDALSDNYMLANNITDASSMTKTIGSAKSTSDDLPQPLAEGANGKAAFSGHFDGMFHIIKNLHPTKDKWGNAFDVFHSYAGLFAYTNGATIENVGVENANIQSYRAGGIVGYAYDTDLRNVWNAGGTGKIGIDTTVAYVGGIVGAAIQGTQLTNAYNAGIVYGSGLVGYLNNSGIRNAYNIGFTVTDDETNSIYGAYQFLENNSKIANTYSAVKYLNPSLSGNEIIGNEPGAGNSSTLTNSFKISSAADLSSWIAGADTAISADGGNSKTWRYYANLPTVDNGTSAEQLALKRASLPMLTAFFKGTVSTDYDYDGELTQGTRVEGINSLSDNPAHKVYDATGVFSYVEATNGAYIIENGKYVLAPSNTAANVKRYNRTTVIKYLGMNVDTPQDANTTPTGIAANDRKDVAGSAEMFALLSSGQQGYDLYGNNFQLDKRSVYVNITPESASKVYDGQSENTYSGAALSNSITGLLSGDSSVTLGGEITYNYGDKDVHYDLNGNPAARTVGISHTTLSLTGAGSNNYTPDFSNVPTSVQGTISPRKVAVGLKTATGIDKVYDGTADVYDQLTSNKFLPSENVELKALTTAQDSKTLDQIKSMLQTDGVVLAYGNATYASKNVAFDTNGDVTSQTVSYTGIGLTNNDLKNYVLTKTDGTTLTTGTLTGTGTIKQREVTFGTAAADAPFKEYDGSSSLAGADPIALSITGTVDDGKSSTTGLLTADAKHVKFMTSGDVKFYDNTTTFTDEHLTANASNSTLAKRAEAAKFEVAVDTRAASYTGAGESYDETIANNYKCSTGAVRTGTVIAQRTIKAKIKTTSIADKTYDGSASVAAPYAGNDKNWEYSDTSAGTSATALKHQLVDADTDAENPAAYFVTTGTYKITNGEANAADVAFNNYDTADQVRAKDIDFTLALAGANASNYALTVTGATTGTGKINQKILTATATQTAANVSKVYDGTNAVEASDINASNLVVSGWIDADATIYNSDDTRANIFNHGAVTATYGTGTTDNTFVAAADPDKGAYDVKYSGLALPAVLKSKNYTISSTAYGKGMITAKKISLSDLKGYVNPTGNLTKTYDGSVNYPDTQTAPISALLVKDYLTVNADAVAAAVAAGTVASDVTADLVSCINGHLTVTAGEYSGSNAGSYGGTNGGTVKMKFTTSNMGTVTDGYFDVGNYSFESGTIEENGTEGRVGTISKRPITVTYSNPTLTKIYDGDAKIKTNGVEYTADEIKGFFTLDTSVIISGDTVLLKDGITAQYTNTAGTEADKNAGTNKKVTYTGIALNDAAAINYSLKDSQGQAVNNVMQGVGTISKRTITVDGYGYVTKNYDGNANVSSYAIRTKETTAEANNQAKAKTDWEVLAGDLITDANGVISSGLTATYLSTSGEGAANVRRGNNRAVLNKKVQYMGLATRFGDNYTVIYDTGGADSKESRKGSYSDANNGTLVVTDGGKISGQLINLSTVEANSFDQTYNSGTTVDNAKSHLSNIPTTIPSDLLTISGSFADKNVGNGKTVTYTITVNPNSTSNNNYDIEGVNPGESKTVYGTGNITPKTITVAYNPVTKVYDSNVNVTDTIAGAIVSGQVYANDEVTLNLNDATGEYSAADAGTYTNTVTYAGVTLSGADKDNYTATLTGSGTITKKQITFTLAGTNFEKDYNQSTAFTAENNTALVADVKAWWDTVCASGDKVANGKFGVDEAQLIGVYGTWDPNTKTFKENSHVKYNGAINPANVATQDVYYTVALTEAAAKNYEWTTGTTTAAKVLNEDGSTRIQNTVYFQNAMGTGKIKPLAVTMANVSSNSTPIYKVYDGTKTVNGLAYNPTTHEVGTTQTTYDKYFNVFYDHNGNGIFEESDGDVKLDYTATATFTDTGEGANDGKNAGTNKAVKYANFALTTTDATAMGDYGLTTESIAGINNYYNDPTSWTGATTGHAGTLPTTGSIARRLLNVAANDGKDHTKTYDGNAYSLLTYSKDENGDYVANPLAYTVAAKSTQNDDGTGRVGKDKVSVTYVANFIQTPGGNDAQAQDVNFVDPTIGTYSKKDVVYTFTLSGDDAANYTIVADKRTVGDGGTTTSDTQHNKSAIKPREVYVDFKRDEQGQPLVDLDKTYDGTPLLATGMSVNDILTLVANGNDTGVVAGENILLNGADIEARYVDATGTENKNVAFANGAVTTRDVYFQNFTLTGTSNTNNYVVKVKNGANKKSVTDPTTTARTLVGKGKINQREVDVALKDDGSVTPITKVYNRSAKVEDYTDATDIVHKYASDNVKNLPATGVNDGLVDGDNLGLLVDSAIYFDSTAAGSDTPTNPEAYATYNAGGGLGVSYKLKWNNQNYTLARTRLYSSNGEIKQRTLVQQDPPAIVKTYDGTVALGDTSSITTGLFGNVVRGDEATLLTIDRNASQYSRANVYAATDTAADIAAAGTHGTAQNVTVVYTLNDATGSGKNYQLAGTDERGGSYNGVGTGRIDRAQVTMSPTEVSYYPSQLANATYTGQVAGVVNGDNRPTMTYGRDGNSSTAVGSYTLLGYVNGKQVPVNGAMFADGFENYYFTTTQNSALTILAEPVKPDVPVVPDIPTVLPDMGNKPVTKVVTESVISDTKFTPDECSYNRMSKDPDTTHVNRVSSATLQYSEKGVNIEGEDTKSGLASLADVQGRGSVVNLNGALIQTSAPAEQPEKVAETAALPISETDTTEDATLLPLPENEENDVSSIGLEYVDNTGGSQSVLEILTNASSKAENKGTSIVIDTQDEDEEDAEIEKTRRAIFADRSNIGIETLGNAVNLNQMIG